MSNKQIKLGEPMFRFLLKKLENKSYMHGVNEDGCETFHKRA